MEMTEDNKNNLVTLLDDVRTVTDRHQMKANLTGSNFNIYSIANIERAEVATHSAMIAELLNINGSHYQGVTFLQHFIESVFNSCDIKSRPSISDYSKSRVVVEHYIGKRGEERSDIYGRIDIVLWLGEHLILIENKIDAPDQKRQLKRYHSWMEKQKKSHKHLHLFYLTKQGLVASEESLDGLTDNDYYRLSYTEDIFSWLELCIKDSITAPILLGGLLQYKQLIQKITRHIGHTKLMDLLNILSSNEKQMEAALDIHNLLKNPETEVALQIRFWDQLIESINNKSIAEGLLLNITKDTDFDEKIKKLKKLQKNKKPTDIGITITSDELQPYTVRIFVAVKAIHIGIGVNGSKEIYNQDNVNSRGDKYIIEKMKEIVTWKHMYDSISPARTGLLVHTLMGKHIIENNSNDTSWLNFDDFISTYINFSLYKATEIEQFTSEVINIIDALKEVTKLPVKK
jgi:predicted RNase H-related nuclease YkuK (DUF458 family)